MRNLDFEKKENFHLLDLKNLIQKLMNENYTICRIKRLLNLSGMQVKMLLKLKYSENVMHEITEKNDVTEEELINGISDYNYEMLSPSEKTIYNNIENYDKRTRKYYN